MSRHLSVLLASLMLSLTACATAPAAKTDSQAGANSADEAMARIAGKVMTEENVGLLFSLMRQSLKAEAEGKPVPELSAEEKARLEAGAKEMQRQALEAAMRMLDEVEKEMRQAVREETRR
jgi:starvation-inducible outer membrane lipoprotein